jgi:hypothetical protein
MAVSAANRPAEQDGPMAHGYRQPTAEPETPNGVIVVDAKFMPLALFLYAFTPTIGLDGAPPAPGPWGQRTFAVAPGRHRLHIHVPYFLPPRLGPADMVVDVQARQTVRLEYRAPLVSWAKGSFGPPPQSYKGAWSLALIVGALPLLAMCALGISLFVGH